MGSPPNAACPTEIHAAWPEGGQNAAWVGGGLALQDEAISVCVMAVNPVGVMIAVLGMMATG